MNCQEVTPLRLQGVVVLVVVDEVVVIVVGGARVVVVKGVTTPAFLISGMLVRHLLPRFLLKHSTSTKENVTLQTLMNTKLRQHRFWPCHDDGLINTIQTIPHSHL